MQAIIDFFETGISGIIDTVLEPFQFITDTIEEMFSIFPLDIALALLTIGGFLIVLAIKRVVV